jgi:hypothetical protein
MKRNGDSFFSKFHRKNNSPGNKILSLLCGAVFFQAILPIAFIASGIKVEEEAVPEVEA